MIKVIRYPEQRVQCFDSEGVKIGDLNERELLEVQCQIVEQKLDGYFIMFNDEKIPINEFGEIQKYPKGLFEESMILFRRLFNARKIAKFQV